MFITRMPERATENAVSHKTILNVLGTLSTILATARDWGYNCEQINLTKLRLPARDAASSPPFLPWSRFRKSCCRMSIVDPEDPNRVEGINGFNSLGVYGHGFDSHRPLHKSR